VEEPPKPLEFDVAQQPTAPEEHATTATQPTSTQQKLPTDRPEVVRRAWALYDEAQHGTADKPLSSTEELALRRQYLEVAAQEYLSHQAARRRRLLVAGATTGLLLLVGLGWVTWVFLNRPPPPIWYTFASHERGWALHKNRKTKASMSFGTESNGQPYGILTVAQMTPEDSTSSSSYFVGIITRNHPVDVSRYPWVIVYVRGEGIPFARPCFWLSRDETWVGPKLALHPQWIHYTISLSGFTHNIHEPGIGWRQAGQGHPGVISNIEIQAGLHVNDVSARGKVFVGPIIFLPAEGNSMPAG